MRQYVFQIMTGNGSVEFERGCASIATALNALSRSEHVGREIINAHHYGLHGGRISLNELTGRTVPPFKKRPKPTETITEFDFVNSL